MEKYYCPECHSKLEKKEGCGSISYFCYTCKKLISRSKMLTEEQLDEQKKMTDAQDIGEAEKG